MSVLAALFRNSHEADEAVSELRLRGVEEIYEQSFGTTDSRPDEADGRGGKTRIILANGPGFGGESAGTLASWGRDMASSGSIGWTLFQTLKVDDGKRREWAERGYSLVVVDAGENGAIVRTILETNGAEEIHNGQKAMGPPD